jgi:hypothetical protein
VLHRLYDPAGSRHDKREHSRVAALFRKDQRRRPPILSFYRR